MDGLAWVFFCLLLFPLPFLFWFGIIPLWVDRRLRRVGKETVGLCRNISSSEGRYSTSFEFTTEDGERIIYISPLSGREWGTPGEEAVMIYDPSHPWRIVRSRRELDTRSEAWSSLWTMLVVQVLLCAPFVGYINY
ncbi:DUF3592 domain-containing protein [Streptomyces triticiradicis]|uniref:DUF3592 domain-containing protein n=1 Tax=Streptomyces triticiradicis TaxID=2651189 RepID=A0A7J5DIA8_9ACTN|nr:DUF3592 domain-containing protein [Streptomyces triticiradicis]KAB1988401.1 hypothetical protein F8144_12235 [Streptomyces triticiradicis]